MDSINYDHPFAEHRGGFVTASMILGGVSILALSTFVLPVFFGSLGVLFALLAKRGKDKFRSANLFGFVTSLTGLVMGAVFSIVMFVNALHFLEPENRAELNRIYEQTYGISFDEYTDSLYGGDFSELLDRFYE